LGAVAAAPDAAGVHSLPESGWCFLPAWHVLGPFGQRFGLEHDDAAVAEVAPLWLDGSAPALSYRQPEDRCGVPAASLDEAAPVRWQDANCLTPRLMPPWERPGFFVRFAGQVWYAAARVRCDKPREIALALETSDHAKLWINGRLVWSDVEKPWRYRSRGHALVPAKLAAGVNELLLRVHKDRRQSWVRVALRAGAYSQAPAAPPERPPVASGGAEASASPRAPDRFVYPDAAPPLAWDIDKGINVAWRRDDLAGSSRPLPAGDALFVAAAPEVLLCLDAATGKTRWSAEANVLELRDAKAMEAWKTADEAGRVKLLADLGLRIRKMDELPTSEPLSDGRRVWLHTPAGAVACFGIDGKRQWMVDAQLSRAELHLYRDTLVVEGRVASGWPLPEELMPKGKRAAAPNVSGVLLLDAATGAVRTRFTIPDAFERDAGRMIVRGSGADEAAVLLTSTSRLVDLRARRLLGMLDVEFPGPDDTSYHKGVQIIGSKPGRPFGVAVSGDVLCMTSQEQSMAVRFRPAGGGRLAYDQLWESNYGHSGFGSFQATSVATGRHLFSWMPVLDRGPHCPDPRVELHVQDLQTGRVRRILKPALRGAVNHQVMPAVAGGYVFCTDFGGGGFGGLSGHGQMLVAAADEHIRPVCRNLVDLGTRAAPAFAGARMFLRSPKALTCIAVTGPEGVLYQRRKVASALLDEIGPALTTPAPLEPQPVDPNVLGPHAPVGELLDGRATEHWLSAGPMAACADEAALASLRPRAGEEFTGGGEKKTFAPVGRKFAYTEPPIYRRQANLQGTGDIVPFFYTYVDPNCCASPKSFGLLYAVLDNPRDRYVTCMMSAPGLTVWLGGLKLALGGDAPQLIHLRPGLYPLLIRVGPAYYNPPAADMPPLPGLEVERRDLRLKPAFKEIPHPPTQRANRLDRIRRLSAELKAVVSEVPGTPEAASAKAMLEEIKGG